MMQRNQTNSWYKNLTSPTRPPPFDRNSAGRDRFNTRTRAYQFRSPGDVVSTGGRWETNQMANGRIEPRRKVGSARVETGRVGRVVGNELRRQLRGSVTERWWVAGWVSETEYRQ